MVPSQENNFANPTEVPDLDNSKVQIESKKDILVIGENRGAKEKLEILEERLKSN